MHNKRLNPTSTALLVLRLTATLAQNKQLRSGGLAGRWVAKKSHFSKKKNKMLKNLNFEVDMKYCLIFSLLMISSLAVGNTPFGLQEIDQVIVHDSGNLVLKLHASSHSEPCHADTVNHLVLNPSSPHLKEMYSTALAAKMAGKKIFGYVNGCVSIWGKDYPKATLIAID